jgi:hypothetical protein
MKRAIVILGGGLIKDQGAWRTIDLGERMRGDAPSNGRWRVDAAFYLWQENKDALIVVSGGVGQFLKNVSDAPTTSSVIKRELIALGMPEEVVIEERRSNTTFEQLLAICDLVKEENFKELIILSNEWHLPRVKAMIDCNDQLRGVFYSVKITLVSAEEVLLKADPKNWQSKILEGRKSPLIEERLKLEERGVKDIMSGNYDY